MNARRHTGVKAAAHAHRAFVVPATLGVSIVLDVHMHKKEEAKSRWDLFP